MKKITKMSLVIFDDVLSTAKSISADDKMGNYHVCNPNANNSITWNFHITI